MARHFINLFLAAAFFALVLPVQPVLGQTETEKEISKLIQDLGDDSFQTREKASKRLLEIGEPALPALQKALKSEDAEVRWRASRIYRTTTAKLFDAASKKAVEVTVPVVLPHAQLSGTVIYSDKKKSHILTCSYGFYPNDQWWGNGDGKPVKECEIEIGGKSYTGKVIYDDNNVGLTLVEIEKGGLPVAKFAKNKLEVHSTICQAGVGANKQAKIRKGDVREKTEKGDPVYGIEIENGDGGAGIFALQDRELYLHAVIWGVESEGGAPRVVSASEIATFLKDSKSK
jgi:hypothetical protein